jgi:ariadne-1
MGPWSEHGGSYYKCNKYVEPKESDGVGGKLTKEDEERMARRELDRYLHYYQRYQGHDTGAKYAASKQTAIVEKKMAELQVRSLSG